MDPVEPVTYTASTSASTSSGVPAVGFDIISPIVETLSGKGSALGIFTLGGLLAVLGTVWSIFTVIAYIVSAVLIGLYVYASVHKKLYEDLQEQMRRDAERLFDEQFRGVAKNSRLNDVFIHADSANPNDWKLAIIEADIILDDILKRRGYAGNSLGERLKSISPQQLSTLSDAWEAHKVRNRIAHDGADFVLTQRVAHETISRYQRVFAEFGEV
tara:strand:+ start:2084 stop:2728 length:645 start_codon:yes stop_codon:yes gene_type:complete